jgi:glycosyltransferase involved in cell wall biosynthesis
VQPYRGEGFCLPIAEAMACGKPALVTGIGARWMRFGEAKRPVALCRDFAQAVPQAQVRIVAEHKALE